MKKWLLRLRSAILVYLTHRIALPVLKFASKPIAFNWSELDLYQLPEGTLGHDLYCFLEKRNLGLLKHYARHDIKHVLLGYDTTDVGEASLQCFMMGNGRLSFPVLATVIYSFVTMPEHWSKMKQAYREGRACQSFQHWQWNELMPVPTTELRNKIFKTAA